MAVEKCGLTREDNILMNLHFQDIREPSYSHEREKFIPFVLAFSEEALAAIVAPRLQRTSRGPQNPTLSPEFIVFHPVHRALSREVARAMDALSRDNPETYGDVVASQEELLPSLYARNWAMYNKQAIPCAAFRGEGSPEAVMAMGRALIEASDDIFSAAALAAPMDTVPRSLLSLSEIRSR
jgi:hypothetical protein